MCAPTKITHWISLSGDTINLRPGIAADLTGFWKFAIPIRNPENVFRSKHSSRKPYHSENRFCSREIRKFCLFQSVILRRRFPALNSSEPSHIAHPSKSFWPNAHKNVLLRVRRSPWTSARSAAANSEMNKWKKSKLIQMYTWWNEMKWYIHYFHFLLRA